MSKPNNYLNQSWPIAGGGIAEPVVEAIDGWRGVIAEAVHPR